MIDGVLRLLDVLMGLREPVVKEPPPPPDNGDTLSDENLRQLYLELGAEMRALRATEFSVANLFYVVAAFLLTASLGLLAAEKVTYLVKAVCTVVTVIFLLRFWFAVHSRIAHDNASYTHLMACRRFIEKRWFWEGMPGKPANIGDKPGGRGHRMTQALVALSALAVSGILVLVLLLTANWSELCVAREIDGASVNVKEPSSPTIAAPPVPSATSAASVTPAASAASAASAWTAD